MSRLAPIVEPIALRRSLRRFKYYYLLFSEPDYLSLDDFVFNTEAHPFRIPKRNAFSAKEEGKVDPPYLWEGPEPELDAKYDPPSAAKAGRESGWGTFIQVRTPFPPDDPRVRACVLTCSFGRCGRKRTRTRSSRTTSR